MIQPTPPPIGRRMQLFFSKNKAFVAQQHLFTYYDLFYGSHFTSPLYGPAFISCISLYASP